jgi:ankyrin repeat protein
MNSNTAIKNISEPAIYHREYENDLPKKEDVQSSILGQCLRVTQVALPFISLYKPIGQPLSIVLGSARVISSVAQMVNAISSKDSNAIGKTALETAIATTALACSILAHPLGMVVTTAHDMVMNVTQLTQAVQDKDYQKAAEIGLHLANNALYLGCFFAGSLELSIASIGFQIFLGLYNSCDEFKKGNYLEGCGHALMAGIRGKQMYDQIKILQFQKAFEKMLKDLKAQQAKAAPKPAEIAQTAVSEKQEILAAGANMVEAHRQGLLSTNNEEMLVDRFKSGALQQEVILKEIDPNTLIHKAILENAPEVLTFLLNHHVDVNYLDANGMSPLTIAILCQKPPIVKLLLDNGANVSPEKRWNGMSLLEITMKARDLESMKYLIIGGADVNEPFKDGKTPVDIALQDFGANWDVLNLLVDSSRLSKDNMEKAFARVSDFFDKSSSDLFLKLIQKGVDVNCFQGAALFASCLGWNNSGGHLGRVKILLSNGANPNLCKQDGWSPLMAAQAVDGKEHLSVTKALLDAGANPNHLYYIDKDGSLVPHQSALSTIIIHGGVDALATVKLLVEAGADINTKIQGKTPLEIALEWGRMDVVRYLLLQANT